MIKAAIIIERADISLGGAERSIYELTTQLAAMGVKVTTLAAKGNIVNENFHILCNDVDAVRSARPKGKRCRQLKQRVLKPGMSAAFMNSSGVIEV